MMKLELKNLVIYAGASGDFNEIHYNFDVAKKSGFEKPIVHGMLTMALCISEVMRKYNIDTKSIKKVRASFRAPILIGEDMIFEIEDEGNAEVEETKKVKCFCKVDGKISAECEIVFFTERRHENDNS